MATVAENIFLRSWHAYDLSRLAVSSHLTKQYASTSYLAQSPFVFNPQTLRPDFPIHPKTGPCPCVLSLYPQNGSTGLGGSGPVSSRLFSLISAVFLVYFSISSKSIAFSTMT